MPTLTALNLKDIPCKCVSLEKTENQNLIVIINNFIFNDFLFYFHSVTCSMYFFLFLSLITSLQAKETSTPALSITFNSTQIAQNILQVQQEYALHPKIGLGFSEGLGLLEDERSYQIGLLSRYYVLGDFNGGIGIGGDISYTAYVLEGTSKNLSGHLLSPSILMIGKYIFDVGFTIEPVIGVQYSSLFAKTPIQDSVIITTDWDSIIGLRLGWSI